MKQLFLLIFFFVSCNFSGEVSISNANKDTLIQINTNTTYPTNLQLEIKGQTNDTFIINNIFIPGGIIDTTINLDWYYKDFQIKYKAYKVSKGYLTIKCRL